MTRANIQSWSEGVSIIIPTFQRPDDLKRALESLAGQSAGARKIEIVIADNDPQASAKTVTQTYKKTSEFPVTYTHVPEPGVSNARNGALAKARGRFIIFLDDDMTVGENWVSTFIDTALIYKAGVVFLPADAVMPEATNPLNAYMQPFFSRRLDMPEGVIDTYLGTGGAMLDLSLCPLETPPFDTSRNEIGGEDDLLFSGLMEQEVNFAWSDKAVAYEHVPPHRATESYLWTRNFAFGQGPTQAAADKGLMGLPSILKWMCIGGLQTVCYGPIYLILKTARKPAYAKFMAKTAQGLGKIFWWDRFVPRLYGVSALKTPQTSSD